MPSFGGGDEVVVGEGELGDEQRHGEADAGEHGDADELAPHDTSREFGDAEADRSARRTR